MQSHQRASMERSLSRSLPYLPRYQSLSPARSPCVDGQPRRFASLRSVVKWPTAQSPKICYIDGEEATPLALCGTNRAALRSRGSASLSPSPAASPKRSYKVHLFCPGASPKKGDGKKQRVHHAARVTRSLSAHDLYSSHVYVSQDDIVTPSAAARRAAEAGRACTSCNDLFHKRPFFPDATTTSESGVSLGTGLSEDENSSFCGGEDNLDNLSLLSFGSSTCVFHDLTSFDSDHDRYESASEGYHNGADCHGKDRSLGVLYEDDLTNASELRAGELKRLRHGLSLGRSSSPLNYYDTRLKEVQMPSDRRLNCDSQGKYQALSVLIPSCEVTDAVQQVSAEKTCTGDVVKKLEEKRVEENDTSAFQRYSMKSPGEDRVMTPTPLAQSTPHVSPRSAGDAKLTIRACWDADIGDDSTTPAQFHKHQLLSARALVFDADTSMDTRDWSSCNSSQSGTEDNFSDVSSATTGSSFVNRKTKLVKRSSDTKSKTAKIISQAHEQDVKIGEMSSKLDVGKSLQHKEHLSNKSDMRNKQSSSSSSNNSPGNNGCTKGTLEAGETWQDQQTLHDKEARTLGVIGLSEDDDGDEGDEEDEEETGSGNDGDGKKSSVNSKVRKVKSLRIAAGCNNDGTRVQQDADTLSITSPGKINIPLISAGKYGQEKLKRRQSQSSPPLSPPAELNTQTSVQVIDTKNNQSLNLESASCLHNDMSDTEIGNASSAKMCKYNVESTNKAAGTVNSSLPEMESNRNNDKTPLHDATAIHSGIDRIMTDNAGSHTFCSDDQGTKQDYDRYVGSRTEVTGISEVTAGHSTNDLEDEKRVRNIDVSNSVKTHISDGEKTDRINEWKEETKSTKEEENIRYLIGMGGSGGERGEEDGGREYYDGENITSVVSASLLSPAQVSLPVQQAKLGIVIDRSGRGRDGEMDGGEEKEIKTSTQVLPTGVVGAGLGSTLHPTPITTSTDDALITANNDLGVSSQCLDSAGERSDLFSTDSTVHFSSIKCVDISTKSRGLFAETKTVDLDYNTVDRISEETELIEDKVISRDKNESKVNINNSPDNIGGAIETSSDISNVRRLDNCKPVTFNQTEPFGDCGQDIVKEEKKEKEEEEDGNTENYNCDDNKCAQPTDAEVNQSQCLLQPTCDSGETPYREMKPSTIIDRSPTLLSRAQTDYDDVRFTTSAQNDGETQHAHQTVRVVATAENKRTPLPACDDKDQQYGSCTISTTGFPAQQSRVSSNNNISLGYNSTNISNKSDSSGVKCSEQLPSVSVNNFKDNCMVSEGEGLVRSDNNNYGQCDDSRNVIRKERSFRTEKEDNTPWQTGNKSIQEGEQTVGDGSGHGNKGVNLPFNEKTTGLDIVKTKEVRVTEVSHKVTKRTHTTTVEKNHPDFTNQSSISLDTQITRLPHEKFNDSLNKITTLEDIEDTVTTTKTITTTTVDSSPDVEIYGKTRDVNNACGVKPGFDVTINVNSKDLNHETSNILSTCRAHHINNGSVPQVASVVHDDTNATLRTIQDGEAAHLTYLRRSQGDHIVPPSAPFLQHNQLPVGDPSADHVMREVTHTWQARPDPVGGESSCCSYPVASPPMPPSPTQTTTESPGKDTTCSPMRHADVDKTYTDAKMDLTDTENRLDCLQARLAQISGLDSDTIYNPSTHRVYSNGNPSARYSNTSTYVTTPPPSSSVDYRDHGEATSVLKQIVRGDTDDFDLHRSYSTSTCGNANELNSLTDCADDSVSVVDNSGVRSTQDTNPTYYSYTIEVNDPDKCYSGVSDNTISTWENDEGVWLRREQYDNDYDNAPPITTSLPTFSPRTSHHHHHHLQLLKPGNLKASSLWTLQEETESLLGDISPKPTRRTLTSLASDDDEDDTGSVKDDGCGKVSRDYDNLGVKSDILPVDTPQHAPESSDFDDESDGNYSSISTGESASYRSSSCGREQTPLSDDGDYDNQMDYRYRQTMPTDGRGLQLGSSSVDGNVSSFNDFVSGLENNSNQRHRHVNRAGGLTLDSLTASLQQFRDEPLGVQDGGSSLIFSHLPSSELHIREERDVRGGQNAMYQPQHSTTDVDGFSDSHHDSGVLDTSAASTTTILSQQSWVTVVDDCTPSEASFRLHALDLDLSRISSCGSPVPSELSEASSSYTCTGTAQIRRSDLHVSFKDTPTAAALLSPPTRDFSHVGLSTSTPKSKLKQGKQQYTTLKHTTSKCPPSPKDELRQKYVDENVRQFDKILHDFKQRTDPMGGIADIEIVPEQQGNQPGVLLDKTSNANISNLSPNYENLYKSFTNEDSEKKQNNTCPIVEDENMGSYRFKRYLRKSHTKRNKKGKKVLRFLSRLSCVSEGVRSPNLSQNRKGGSYSIQDCNLEDIECDSETQNTNKPKIDSNVSSEIATSRSTSQIPKPQLASSTLFQHRHDSFKYHQTPPEITTSHNTSTSSPSQGSPASSTQSMGSGRSRTDSAYSSVSGESISHGSSSSAGSPRHHLFTSHSTNTPSASIVHKTDITPESRRLSGESSSANERAFSTDSAFGSTSTDIPRSQLPSEVDQDRTLLAASESAVRKTDEDMMSALSDVFEQLDVCEGQIDQALLNRMRYGHHRVIGDRH